MQEIKGDLISKQRKGVVESYQPNRQREQVYNKTNNEAAQKQNQFSLNLLQLNHRMRKPN